MKRIKTMLMALMAILAIGAVGASVASADGTGRVEVVGTGGCDIDFTNTDWDGDDDEWMSETESVTTQVGGDCDVDNVSGNAEIVKRRVDGNGVGSAELSGTFSFRVIGGLVNCTYTTPAPLTGTWHWTNHWAPPGPPTSDPDIPHAAGNINNPGNPATDDKMFHVSGTANRVGFSLICPSTATVEMHLRDHANH